MSYADIIEDATFAELLARELLERKRFPGRVDAVRKLRMISRHLRVIAQADAIDERSRGTMARSLIAAGKGTA
jgi:hypothetical protein